MSVPRVSMSKLLLYILTAIKVGINLGDPVFRGIYHGKRAHDDDLQEVLQRALEVGCQKMMVTGSDLKESIHAAELAEKYRTSDILYPWPLTERHNSGHMLRNGRSSPLLIRTV